MDGPPIEGGAVLIGPDGRVIAAGAAPDVPAPPDARPIAYPGAVLLPGLVNLHTHLELTGFEDQVEADEFPVWIRRLRALKAERSPDDYREAARRGIREAFAMGVTTVADTGDSGAVLPALAELGASGIGYQEVFGPDPAQLETSLAGLAQAVERLAPHAGARAKLGVSPHAPYTVSGPLYAAVASFARARGLPLAVHLAESAAEQRFVTRGDGPFADLWRARGIPPLDQQLAGGRHGVGPLRSPVAWLDHHAVLGPDTLCIHTVELDDADLEILASRGVGIAHCPRSNARHGHGTARLGEIRRRGIRVGIGTDSVASIGPLDLMAELRVARSIAGLSAEEALALATTDAARVLGMANEIGRLTPGAWGDVGVVRISVAHEDVLERVLASGPTDVVATYVAGRRVHEARSRL
jgi:5-methylthioadenosine/S-adenosylhomocysteine deaminase